MTDELNTYTLYRINRNFGPDQKTHYYRLERSEPRKPSLVLPLPTSVTASSLAELAEKAIEDLNVLELGKGIDKLTTIPAPVIDITFGKMYDVPASVEDLLEFQVLFANRLKELKASKVK
jgi:hypothetical protein